MKMSNEKRAELYSAIREPITDFRILRLRSSGSNIADDRLIRLENEIWGNVKKALNLKDKTK